MRDYKLIVKKTNKIPKNKQIRVSIDFSSKYCTVRYYSNTIKAENWDFYSKSENDRFRDNLLKILDNKNIKYKLFSKDCIELEIKSIKIFRRILITAKETKMAKAAGKI